MGEINHKITVEYLSIIFLKSRKSKLDFGSDIEVNNAFKYLSTLFNLSHIQCAILSLVFAFTTDDDLERLYTQRLIDYLDLNMEFFFDIKGDLEILIKKGFIKQKKNDRTDNLFDSAFSVNQKLLDMLFRNEEIQFEKLYGNGYNFTQFCGHMYRINNRKLLDNLSREDVLNSVIEQEDRNENLTQIQTMKSLGLEVMDRLMIYYLVHKYSENEFRISSYSIAFDVLGPQKVEAFLSELKAKKTQMQLTGMIELSENMDISLTSKIKELLLSGEKSYNEEIETTEQKEVETTHYYIKHQSIPDRPLYFNSDLQRELNMLITLFQKDNFAEYQKEMKKRGNKAVGASILLFGPTGTGKTSVSEFISKQSKRNIFQVDLSQVRSKWYSESEKNVKKIFDDYKLMCSNSDTCPILLFNECDALMGKRKTTVEEKTDMTEQTIVNLLLELIEKNEGIIIAITNLVEQLDNAFLRRFAFKIHIGKPDMNAVKSILKSKIDFLTEAEVNKIAQQFSLTGGQIENISTKCIISKIITKSFPTVSEILDFCAEESLKTNPWIKV